MPTQPSNRVTTKAEPKERKPASAKSTAQRASNGAKGAAARKSVSAKGASTAVPTLSQRDLVRALGALKRGDFNVRLPDDLDGLDAQVATTFNELAAEAHQLEAEAVEVFEAVAQRGIARQRIRHSTRAGGWKRIAQSASVAMDQMTDRARRFTELTRALTNGDFEARIAIEDDDGRLQGQFLAQADAVNTLAERLSTLSREVARTAQSFSLDGELNGRISLPGAKGEWRDTASAINQIVSGVAVQLREILRVTTAVGCGDLSQTISVVANGELKTIKTTINSMIAQLAAFTTELSRLAREVGTEGRLGGHAHVPNAQGVWQSVTANLNLMTDNLTLQVRNITEVSAAIAQGDLSQKISVEVGGELLAHKQRVNATVDQLRVLASEVTRVARQVGTDGVFGGQAVVPGASGVWKDLVHGVNSMAENLTLQVRNVAEVATAIADGDLSKQITADARGEFFALKTTINATVDRLKAFSNEVTRVARMVGTEGQLGVQAHVPDASGTWRELTDNVNSMASNLTAQVRGIAEVTTAVARGDLTRKITVDARGELQELKATVNTMVDQLSAFAHEVTQLATDVGVEGTLGGQADVRGVSGTWRTLTDAVNSMARNLTNQVRSISEVATAVAEGDLTRKVTVEAKGEILELKSTINTMTAQLSAFSSEVTRVALEVGTEGKLGGQASVASVRGTWRDLTAAVNLMAANLTAQVRDIAEVSGAVARGDLTRKIAVEARGEFFDLKTIINTMIDQLDTFAEQVTRVAREVSVDGRLGGRAQVRGASGVWKELTENVNRMVSNLSHQVRDIADVTTSVAQGDLSKKITVEVQGELLQLKTTINRMVDELGAFSSEVTRVAREVGTEGKLGGQAKLPSGSGIWQELTDNVNLMAANLTQQVRGIARVVTAVAEGDLRQQLHLQAGGEIATLASTINTMTVTLSVFAEQVSGVAREVGFEGRLGGQANVPGASGVWKELTVNVNQLAENLTRQVRAIAEVATAVRSGDLSQTISVDARGEVAELKDDVNRMIEALAETTRANQDKDWLKSNLARLTRMLQGQPNLQTLARELLSTLAETLEAHQGAFYVAERREDGVTFRMVASYAHHNRKRVASHFELGEGLVGQAALERERIVVDQVPADYLPIRSGLGEAQPASVAAAPVTFEGATLAVIELATFKPFSALKLALLDGLLESLGIVMTAIESHSRTDDLLRQSQTMTEELQTQQEELQQTNEELEEKARLLGARNSEVESKSQQVELARREIEEKAQQLELTSKYKSQFLANMSHELRTPLNSLLILSQQLSDNRKGNLDEQQVEYAHTVYQSGVDLLELINEILDLAKIESGTMGVTVENVNLSDLASSLERSFRPVAESKGLEYHQSLAAELPANIATDARRLAQVLRNVIGNALKFTEQGQVALSVRPAKSRAGFVAFDVADTGIGITPAQQQTVFEAFQQADGGTSRKYGGTGLGLAISRELAGLLGGELRLESRPGQGSTFTLYVPETLSSAASSVRPSAQFAAKGEPRLAHSHAGAPPSSDHTQASLPDDREHVAQGDRVLLIVEDDPIAAQAMLEAAHQGHFKGLIAQTGRAALQLVSAFKPDAITLDLGLPDMDGWYVLDRFKHGEETRHIPVHIISASDAERRGRSHGAINVLTKPVTREQLADAFVEIHGFLDRRVRKLLVVEDDEAQRKAIVALIGNGQVSTTAVATAQEALDILAREKFDCAVLDLSLPDMSGLKLMKRLEKRGDLKRMPVVIYTGKDLTREEERELDALAKTVIIKDARSPERLVDETALFLHRVQSDMPEPTRDLLRAGAGSPDPALAKRRVLVVDDDVRNIFALTALLEQHEMVVENAENGQEALDKLGQRGDIDIVLMDVMMPGMDGYEASRRIRESPKHRSLPIIALTAKAMTGDRNKCIEAGASDYITKPVDQEQLLSLLRVWLYR